MGMGAVAYGTETVERGNTERGGEIPIRATARGTFAQSEIHLICQGFGAREESRAHFAFKRRAIEAASDLKAGAPMKWAQSLQAAFEAAHVRNAQRAQIKNNSRAFGDDVGARAAFDDPCIDRDAMAEIIPFFDARELPCQFVDGVDPFLWRETGV